MTPEEIVKRLREGTSGTDETKTDNVIIAYMFRAANLIEGLLAENARLRIELAEARDLSWFWEIVDCDGLNNVCSDERGALSELVSMASENAEAIRELKA